MADKNITMGNLYDLNKSLYAKLPKMDVNDFQSKILNIGMWFSSRTDRKYFMFLCRELNDYTIFEFKNPNYNQAKEELKGLVLSRGIPVAIDYDHDTDSYEIWVKRGNDCHMYKIFPCDDFMIPIE